MHNVFNLKKTVVGLIVLLLFSPIILTFSSDELPKEGIISEQKAVLYISSYSYSLEVVPEQLDGIRKRFENQPIALDVEFMDLKRFNIDENIELFYKLMKLKLDRGLNYDAVIVGDDNGLDFVMTNKDELFPDTPVFFLGINDLERAKKSSLDPMVTGVLEAKSIYETIELGYRLNPEAKRLIIAFDATPSSLGDYTTIMSLEKDFPSLEFITINLSKITHDDYFDILEALNDTDIFISLSAVMDKDDVVKSYDEMRINMNKALSIPIYGLTTVGIGEGVFGGKVISHEEQGYTAADMAMAYFLGTPLEEIPFSSISPNRYIIDFMQFEEFGFDEKKLPADVVFVNRNYSFWEENMALIVFGILIMIFEALIIFFLIKNIISRKKTEIILMDKKREVQNVNDELEMTVQNLEDSIIEINERESEIRKLIYIDELTGMMTRYALKEFMAEKFQDIELKHAIITLDIDDFKNINDAFGHTFGDEIIRSVGERYKSLANEWVEICRFGGDEFIFTLNSYETILQVEEFIKQIQGVLDNEFVIENNKFFLTISIGVALFPDHGYDQDVLIQRADIALNKSKKDGKNRCTFYDDDMDEHFNEKNKFRNALRQGFKKNEFYLNYQPLVLSKSGDICGYEALIRWHSDDFGQVSPYKLITEAEEMGMIVKIGEWVIRESCGFVKNLNNSTQNPKYVSINISAIQLMYSGFVNQVIEIVEEFDINPQNICLEMTETALIKDLNFGGNIIKQLSDYGFKIGLDDFGTGYSSLSYLKNLDIDILKIDKSFVDNIMTSTYDRYLVEAIIKIAEERDIVVLAEGVETLVQFNELKIMHCSVIQGFLFSRPLSRGDALEIVNNSFEDIIQ